MVIQLFPTLVASSLPVLAKSFSWERLSPHKADASLREMSCSPSNDPLAHVQDGHTIIGRAVKFNEGGVSFSATIQTRLFLWEQSYQVLPV